VLITERFDRVGDQMKNHGVVRDNTGWPLSPLCGGGALRQHHDPPKPWALTTVWWGCADVFVWWGCAGVVV